MDTDTRHIAVVECLASVHNYLLADRFVRDVEVPFLSQSPIPVNPVPSGIQLNAVTVDTMSLSWWRTKSVRGSKLCARAGGVQRWRGLPYYTGERRSLEASYTDAVGPRPYGAGGKSWQYSRAAHVGSPSSFGFRLLYRAAWYCVALAAGH